MHNVNATIHMHNIYSGHDIFPLFYFCRHCTNEICGKRLFYFSVIPCNLIMLAKSIYNSHKQ